MATYQEKTDAAVKNLLSKQKKSARIEERLQALSEQLKIAKEEEAVAVAKEILKRMKKANLSAEELFELIEKNAKGEAALEHEEV